MNSERARAAARAALDAYTRTLDDVDVDAYGVDTALTDLLADLMHYADTVEDVSFEAALGSAVMHYEAEDVVSGDGL